MALSIKFAKPPTGRGTRIRSHRSRTPTARCRRVGCRQPHLARFDDADRAGMEALCAEFMRAVEAR